MRIREKIREIFYIKKPWWRFPLIFLLVLVILVGSALAYNLLFSTHKAIVQGISSNLSGNSLINTELKGETDGRVNVLLLGVGVEGQTGTELTDTIILASFDLKDNYIAMLSIPRDLYVKIPGIGYNKINTVYSYGQKTNYQDGAGALAKDTLSNVLGVPIHYYVALDFDGFKEIINTLGGIDIKAENDIYDYEYPSKNELGVSPFILKKGDYHMDGELALKYVRSRKSTSDFDRARRQQQVILAIRDKIFEKKIITNPKRVYDVYDILENHFKTDFQLAEIARAAELAQDFKTENISNYVLDESSDGFLYADNINGAYVLKPKSGDFSEIQKFVHYFVFQEALIKKENAKIELQNGTSWQNLADSLSKKLKKYGLNIININNADRYDYRESIIYDRTGDTKPITVSFLANYLSAKVINKEKSQDDKADITIIIGKNYYDQQYYNQ